MYSKCTKTFFKAIFPFVENYFWADDSSFVDWFRLCTGRFELANFARDLFVLKTFALRKNLHQ